MIYFALEIVCLYIGFRSGKTENPQYNNTYQGQDGEREEVDVDSASFKPQSFTSIVKHIRLWCAKQISVGKNSNVYMCVCTTVRVYDGNRNGNVSRMKLVKTKTVDFPLEAAKYKSNYTLSSLSMCVGSPWCCSFNRADFPLIGSVFLPCLSFSHFLRISLRSSEFKLQLISFFPHGFVLSVDNS